MSELDEPKPGQLWRAIPYTAEDVNHLDYTVASVDAGRVMLIRDDGARREMTVTQLRLYLDPATREDGEQ